MDFPFDWTLTQSLKILCNFVVFNDDIIGIRGHLLYADDAYIKFLGMPVRVSRWNDLARVIIKDNLQRMLGAIDAAPLMHQQKLHLFRFGVCPRLAWPLSLEVLPTTWLERELQPLATRALKKWAGLSRCSNTSILFLPAKKGGLALPLC